MNRARFAALPDAPAAPGRPLTGRAVLIWFVAFFGVIFTANFFLVRAAITSFGGVETESSYKAGLAFKNDEAAAAAQAARHWQVGAHVEREALEVKALDAAGRPLIGLDLLARLHHPTDRRLDVEIVAEPAGPGLWRGVPDAPAGQWGLVIELSKDGERLFRSTNRVILK